MRRASSQLLGLERTRDLAAETRGETDQSLRVLGKEVVIDARLVVVAIQVRTGDQAAQVLVAGPIARQQDQVVRLLVRPPLAVRHRPPGDVGLHADDRLDARRLARLVEGDGPVQRAVIGHRQRFEAEILGLRDELSYPTKTVKEAELRVDVEVNEIDAATVNGTPLSRLPDRRTDTGHGPPIYPQLPSTNPPPRRGRPSQTDKFRTSVPFPVAPGQGIVAVQISRALPSPSSTPITTT